MVTEDLAEIIGGAVRAAGEAGEFTLGDAVVPIAIDTPKNKQHGDFSCNIALTLKKVTGLNDSREIAARILKHIPEENPLIDRVEVAGPGFMNFYLRPAWLHDALVKIETLDDRYGFSELRKGEKVLIEFVSANPTGPISVVNGRAAALGDVLASLFTSQGAETDREFYINDALNSNQLELFAQASYARYLQEFGHSLLFPDGRIEPGAQVPLQAEEPAVIPFPENGYPGEYVRDIARNIVAEVGDRYRNAPAEEREPYFRRATLNWMLTAQRTTLAAFGLEYDTWFSESTLYESGEVDRTIQELKEREYAYEKDGALWLKSTAFGDEKDRVLVRSNEKATYIAADAAYHKNKFDRGYTRLINIWGADHHGYVARLKAGVAALGYDPKNLEIILTQMVSLVRDGEAIIGGKRKGVVIELKEDLIDEIGKDAARFYFLLNSYDAPATVDVELAKKQSNDNPVYYVQYAHARLCNILRTAADRGVLLKSAADADRSLLTHSAELDVLRKLSDYPLEVTTAARDYAPHRLPRFAMELASLLNVFYENCRVLSGQDAPIDPALTEARLALVNGARIVLRNLLALLGITAPEKM